jgi:hypothetical protein
MWLNIALSALLLQAAPQQQPQLAASPRSGNAYTDAAGYAVLNFISTWRSSWLASADWRAYGHANTRLRDVHCHWDGSYGASASSSHEPPPTLIHHSSRRSMCPDWFPSDEPTPDDERLERDVSLVPIERARVRAARSVLLDSLEALDKLHPGDAWITGERVRFLIDQDEAREALAVARHCTAGRDWCAQLTGYAFAAAGDFTRADSAYEAAAAAMDAQKRCEWTSAKLLLDDDGRSAYNHLSCDERTAANERLWWVSTPLFSDSVSDRRSEQFSRKVLVELHDALPWDERYDWRSRFGGEAVSEMLVRYGWPAFSAYGGSQEEADHAGWMTFWDSTRTATAEYPMDRLHLVPQWRAVTDPFHAPADAWQLNMPTLNPEMEPAAQYWPAEHYARAAGGILQLSDQTVMLRRDHDILLATASGLPSKSSLHADTAAVVLVRTTGPHKVERMAHTSFSRDSVIVVTARIPASPALVGTELPAKQKGELSGRTRFGVDPPATLVTLHSGEKAISDPVLLAPNDGPPPGPDNALQFMLGSTHVRGAKVGVYWETYGYAPGDSVDVAVIITRHETLSKMRRIGMFLHVAHDINGSVAVRWQEPQAGHDSWTIPGAVPIHARSIRLDLSRIEPGHYIVQVLVARKGAPLTVLPVTSSRAFIYDGM